MRILLVLCAIVFMAVDRADCNLGNFLNNLPAEIGNAFTTVWNSIVTAIKKPVRIKRLGRAKTTTATTATRLIKHEPIKLVLAAASTIKYDYHPSLRRLVLPVITTPKWQNLEQWKKLQKPTFVWLNPKLEKESYDRYVINVRRRKQLNWRQSETFQIE